MQFGRLKQLMGSREFHNNEKVEIDVREWLRMQNPDFHRDGIFTLVPQWHKCVSVLADRPEK
jgi:hypothetical protein